MQNASSNSSGKVERIVINTGPLITLARIQALDVVGHLTFDFICPAEVREELDEGERCGHMHVAPSWLTTKTLSKTLPRLESVTLGSGEAAVIELALELGIERVCIDEWKGRRAALTTGLKVTGVLGLLGRAKRQGIIQDVKPFVDKALAEGIRYDKSLVSSVLRELEEI